MNEDIGGYFHNFVIQTLQEIKISGIAYAYSKKHINEIKKYVPDLVVKETEYGWSLTSKKRKVIYKEEIKENENK